MNCSTKGQTAQPNTTLHGHQLPIVNTAGPTTKENKKNEKAEAKKRQKEISMSPSEHENKLAYT